MRDERGFTLIELMIVVVVIGLLASIAIPKFRDMATKAKAAEVEPLLRQVLTLEERFRAKEGAYTLMLTDLEGGPTLSTSAKYFDLGLVDHESGFCVVATPNAAGDQARVTARSLDAARTFYESGNCS